MQDIIIDSLDEDVIALETLQIRLGWLSRRRLVQELNSFNLTAPQFVAMRCIQMHAEGCSMSELAESSQQVPATMTGVIDRLAERGLVRRERDLHDRRTLRVVLTPAGKALMDQVSERIRGWIRDFMSTLSAEERRIFLELGQRYLAALEGTVVPREEQAVHPEV